MRLTKTAFKKTSKAYLMPMLKNKRFRLKIKPYSCLWSRAAFHFPQTENE